MARRRQPPPRDDRGRFHSASSVARSAAAKRGWQTRRKARTRIQAGGGRIERPTTIEQAQARTDRVEAGGPRRDQNWRIDEWEAVDDNDLWDEYSIDDEIEEVEGSVDYGSDE